MLRQIDERMTSIAQARSRFHYPLGLGDLRHVRVECRRLHGELDVSPLTAPAMIARIDAIRADHLDQRRTIACARAQLVNILKGGAVEDWPAVWDVFVYWPACEIVLARRRSVCGELESRKKAADAQALWQCRPERRG